MQFELKGREGMDALNRNLAPPFRAGLAGAAVSADVADRLARSQEAGALAAAAAAPKAEAGAKRDRRKPVAAKATATVVSNVGVSQEGGSSGSNDPVLPDQFAVQTVAPAAKAPPAPRRSPSQGRKAG